MTLQFQLDVQHVQTRCLFKLTWGKGQKLMADLPYPETVLSAYYHWEKAYIAFYQTNLDLSPSPLVVQTLEFPSSGFRARVESSGTLAPPPTDWRLRLAQAQVTLLSEFHGWLSGRELLPLRSAIAQAQTDDPSIIELFLTCNTLDLDRLPWETWEIHTEFASQRSIRLARTPMNMPEPPPILARANRRRSRILVILGDDTGLDFTTEKEALKSLRHSVDIVFIGWQAHKPEQNQHLKETICHHLEEAQGWDVLLFIGHSNENLGGGEIAIAPNQGILISELLPSLRQAKNQGLQFALFNSCRGLNIAHSLVSIGFCEVAIMRQPIHNRVAAEFLIQFIQHLTHHQEIHSALIAACNYLKVDKNQTYPSAFLVPSLFRHPFASSLRPIRSPKKGLPTWFTSILPRRRDAMVLGSCMVLSLAPPIQGILLEQRVFFQSIYRLITHQVPVNPPIVRLVQIDPVTLEKIRVSSTNPMDRDLLARIVTKLTEAKAKVIGFDYFFDRPSQDPTQDQALAKAIGQSVKSNQTWFVFAEGNTDQGRAKTAEITGIATQNQSLSGLVNTDKSGSTWYLKQPDSETCAPDCPFPNLLAIAHLLKSHPTLQPKPLNAQTQFERPWQSQVLEIAKDSKHNSVLYQVRAQSELPITNFSRYFQQLWLEPILDFSIPPNTVLETLSAGDLLTQSNITNLKNMPNQVVLIASGGYLEGMNSQDNNDVSNYPLAINYWSSIGLSSIRTSKFTGAQSIAYAIHHQLNQRWVIPVPDLWMIAIAGIVGRSLQRSPRLRDRRRIWLGGMTVYTLTSFQIYITAGILLPCLFPAIVLIAYHSPTRRKSPNA